MCLLFLVIVFYYVHIRMYTKYADFFLLFYVLATPKAFTQT